MSEIINGLSGEDKAGLDRGRQESGSKKQSAILANMLKNCIQSEQTAEFAGVSPDEIAPPASTKSMEKGKGHTPDVRKNLEESMRAHDDLYRELAEEGLSDCRRRPVHP